MPAVTLQHRYRASACPTVSWNTALRNSYARSTGWTPPEFYIQITFVSPSFRNRGVSKALHKLIIDYARATGHKEIYAVIAKWNYPEISVVKSFGFVMTDLGYRFRFSLHF